MATIQGVYIALFGRPADPAGLEYFNEQTNNGANLNAIGDLAATAEYQDRFEGLSNTQIITKIYQSLFGRAPEAAGLEFFAAALENGTLNINNIAIAILDGAQGNDKAIIDNKLTAANRFTESLNTATERGAYQGDAAAQAGVNFLSGVNQNPNSVPSQAATDTAIAAIVAAAPGTDPTPGVGVSIQLTTADDLVSPEAANPAFKSTNANDTILATELTLNAGDSINGGLGNDTLKVTSAGDLKATEATITNVETIVLTNTGNGGLDLAKATGVTFLQTDASTGTVLFDAVSLGTTVGVKGAAGGDITVNFAKATGENDAATLKFEGVTGDKVVTVGAIEAVTVNLTGSNVARLASADAKTVTVTGSGSWDADGAALSNSITKFDAGAATGRLDVDLGGGGVTYIGSKGIDDVTLGAGKDTIVYNSGNVSVNNRADTYAGFSTGNDKIDVKAFDFSGKDMTSFETFTAALVDGDLFNGKAAAQFGSTVYFDINNDGVFNIATDLVVNVAGVAITDVVWA